MNVVFPDILVHQQSIFSDMIRKLLYLKNVGRFENCSWRGGSQLEQVSLIYADNSRGKSTFCDVLRSFKTGCGDYIVGRKRLGSLGDCEARFLSEPNLVSTFQAGKWDATQPEIAIFDSKFVHENVYAGDAVDHSHKKNLYRVIVGAVGIALAEKVEELDGQLREATKVAKGKQEVLTALLPRGTDLKIFNGLRPDDSIAQKISAKEEEIQAANIAQRRVSEINTLTALSELSLPSLPVEYFDTLSETVSTLSASAEAMVQEHLRGHTEFATENWLEEGVSFQKQQTCPFCGQSTNQVPLVAAFKTYFDTAYSTLKSKIGVLEETIDTEFGEEPILKGQTAIGENATKQEFWKQLDVGLGRVLIM